MSNQLPSLPGYVPSANVSRSELNAVSKVIRENLGAWNSVVPAVYGRDLTYPDLILAHLDEENGFWYMAYCISEGPIEAVEKIMVDSVDINDEEEGFLLSEGAAVNTYLGSATQNPDPMLAAAISGYSDDLRGYAYLVFKIPPNSTAGYPKISCIVKGLKVYDPRDLTQSLGDSATWKWTDNASLCFAGFLEKYSSKKVNYDSVARAADANDELVGTGGVTEKKRTIGLTIRENRLIDRWAEVFRAYARCFNVKQNGEHHLIPDRKDADAPGALYFNGVDSKATVVDPVGLDFTSEDFTVDFKLYAEAFSANARLVSRGAFQIDGWEIMLDTGGQLIFRSYQSTASQSATSNVVVPLDEWVRVTVVRTGATVAFYIDEVDETSSAGTLIDPTSNPGRDLTIGNYLDGAYPFEGRLDELRIWSVARSPQEGDFDKELEGDEAGLEAYYKFNATTGDVVTDSGPNGYHGTATGGFGWSTGDLSIIPAGVALHVTSDLIVDTGVDSVSLGKTSNNRRPNVVTIEYTDSSLPDWKTERITVRAPEVEAGTAPARESVVAMPGVHRASQAYREAVERLNTGLNDLTSQFRGFDETDVAGPGSIIALSDEVGLTAKLFRVITKDSLYGRHGFSCVEYDPGVYSQEILEDPTTPDTQLGNPLKPPLVSNLAAVEELFTAKDGTTSSRLKITFDNSNYPFKRNYVADVLDGENRVFRISSSVNEIVTPGLPQTPGSEPVTYTVRVAMETSYKVGKFQEISVDVFGKLLPPGDVPSITLTRTDAAKVKATWEAAIDIDIWRYEVRVGSATSTWEQAVTVERVDGLNYVLEDLPLGQHRVHVKAIDSVENESANSTSDVITLAAPPAPTGLTGFEVGGEVRLSWNAVEGSFVKHYKCTYAPASGGAETLIDIVDALRLATKEVAEGEFTFYIRSMDSAGNVSTSAASTTFEVTSDAAAFIADSYEFSSFTLTNMTSYTLQGFPGTTFYITNMPGDTLVDTPSTFQTHEFDSLANMHSSGTSRLETEVHDFGNLLTGTFVASVDFESLNGTAELVISVSKDNAVWEDYTGVTSVKGEYRYMQMKLEATGTETLLVRVPPMKARVNVVPLSEDGFAVTNTSAATKVTLGRKYGAVKQIRLQAESQAPSVYYDNIILDDGGVTSFEVSAFDVFGQRVAVNFGWTFEGI